MDEATPHLHIDFVPYTTGSKRGLETRVSLKKALAELGFKGGTRSEMERNQWVAAEKEHLAEIMLKHDIEWEKKGTHEKHLSVLDFEKKERAKEVAELEQTISGSKEELSSILYQQIAAGRETEQIRKEGEAIRQEVSELSATNHFLKEQTETLTGDKEKLLSENGNLYADAVWLHPCGDRQRTLSMWDCAAESPAYIHQVFSPQAVRPLSLPPYRPCCLSAK